MLEKLATSRGRGHIHFKNTLSKPYNKDKEKSTEFTQFKRIKRESFALKLAIYNKNSDMLQFLINGSQNSEKDEPISQLSQAWSLANIMQAIHWIVKIKWSEGLKKLMKV